MLDLETPIKGTAADPDFIELNYCIEDNNAEQIPTTTKQWPKSWLTVGAS